MEARAAAAEAAAAELRSLIEPYEQDYHDGYQDEGGYPGRGGYQDDEDGYLDEGGYQGDEGY